MYVKLVGIGKRIIYNCTDVLVHVTGELRIKILFFNRHDVMKTVGGAKIPSKRFM